MGKVGFRLWRGSEGSRPQQRFSSPEGGALLAPGLCLLSASVVPGVPCVPGPGWPPVQKEKVP